MNHINYKNNKLVVTFRYDPKIVAAIKEIPGRMFDPKLKHWEIPVEHGVAALEILHPLGFTATTTAQDAIIAMQAVEKAAFEAVMNPRAYTGSLPLFDFQKKGAAFLAGMPSALLADVPGLGKTIQTIAACEKEERILVLCPASLKYGWAEEIKKWTQYDALVIDGNKEHRTKQWGNFSKYPTNPIKYTIANYELLLHDYDSIPREWDVIVCDEATRISNPEAKTTKNLKKLVAKKRIALTGTPISNSPVDLFSIIDWISPGYFGTFYSFKKNFCIVDPTFHRVIGFKDVHKLAELASRFILRRTKEEVLEDFPKKTFENVIFEISDEERELYEAVKYQILEELDKLTVDPSTIHLMPVKLLRLKQATGHPALISELGKSSKLEALKDLVKPILASDDKVIIFTQFAKMAHLLLEEFNINNALLIDGDVSSERRQEIVNEFNTDPACKVLIMTEAGAYGLNLQSASYVVHYDAPWSIAKLMQREDRAHRIGQKKPVTVYNLVAKNTVDEYVAKVLHKKQRGSVDILQDADRLEATGLSPEDVKEILRL